MMMMMMMMMTWVCTGMDGRAAVVDAIATQQHDRNHRRGEEAVETRAGSYQRVGPDRFSVQHQHIDDRPRHRVLRPRPRH